MTDGVGAGQVAVHAVKRGRLRRPDMGADVFELVPGERLDAAVGRDRRLQRHDAVRRRDRGGEMLEPILDPLDRPAAHPRGDRDQHDVGEHALFDAEAAAGIRRRAQPETMARHFQRPRHDAVQAERPHEVRQHVVGVFGRIVVGDDAVGFDRRAGIARVVHGDRDAVRGLRQHLLGIAVAEAAFAGEIAAQALVQHRLRRIERRERIDHRGQRLVVDLDQVERVFGEIAVGGDDDRDRLADITHPADRDRPAFDRRPAPRPRGSPTARSPRRR